MLNIYYYNCCSIDVHKKMLVATIAKTDEHKVTTYQTKQFSTITKDIEHLKQWLKDKECEYFKLRYEAIKKRRGHKRAIIAIARMLLTCAYHMLFKNEPFNTEVYKQLTESNSKSKHTKLNVNNPIKF